MKVLIIGAEGQLGQDLVAAFSGEEVHTADLDGEGHHLDIVDREAVEALIQDRVQPELVVNAAAAHNVADCEERPDLAFSVNTVGACNLARACQARQARLVHISTDYVFGHGGSKPYVESDLPAPLSYYAASKLAGEHLIAAHCADHLIVRTAAIYGHAPCRAKDGRNFIELMLHLAATQPQVRVVTDEITTPTATAVLARQIHLLAEKGRPGLYHATCQGQASWYEFAQAIFEETATQVTLLPAKAADFQSPVQRPAYSVLDNQFAQAQGIDIMSPWREALKTYLAERQG